MRNVRPVIRGLVAASAAVTAAVGLLPQVASAAPERAGVRALAADVADPLPEATADEKYQAALVVNAGDDLNLQAKPDCDFVHEISLRATGAELVRAANAAFAAGTVSGGSAAECTLFIREGIFEANLRDQENAQHQRAERDARQAAAAAISLEATPALLAMTNYDFVAQVIVYTGSGPKVRAAAEAAVRSNEPAELTAFITTGIFEAHRQDVLDAINADNEKTEQERAAAVWRAAKARALAVIGVVATDEMLVLDDTNLVFLISNRAAKDSEVAAAATEALASFDAAKRKAFIETGIYAANQLDITKALQKQAEENRAAARQIQAKAEKSLVHPALVAAAAAALAGSDADVSKFLRDGQYTAIRQTLRSTVAGKVGWYVRGAKSSASIAAEGTGTDKAVTDAVWKIIPGLGDANCHSLESMASPGHFLREVANEVNLRANDGSNEFKLAATWCASVGKSGSNVSFESKSKPGRFLRHFGTELWASQSGTAHDFDRRCNFEADTTWKIGAPDAPALADKGAGEGCGDITAVAYKSPEYFVQARDNNTLGYGQVSGGKLITPTGTKQLTPWTRMGEIAGGNVDGMTAVPGSGAGQASLQRFDDIIAIERSTGKLWLYPDVKRGVGARVQIGSGGWNGMRELTVGRFCSTNPLFVDVAAVERSTGKLWCYPGKGDSALGAREVIGTGGWNGMELLAGGDFGAGDAVAGDLVAVERSTGIAYLYPGKLDGGFKARVKVNNNWSAYTQLTAGNFNGTGVEDLIAVDKAGKKWLYPGSGDGKFGARVALS
jgi:hypothetical protein